MGEFPIYLFLKKSVKLLNFYNSLDIRIDFTTFFLKTIKFLGLILATFKIKDIFFKLIIDNSVNPILI